MSHNAIELITEAKERLETAKGNKAKADGALEQIERRWREEEKIESVDEAKAKVKELETEVAELEEQEGKLMKELEKELAAVGDTQ